MSIPEIQLKTWANQGAVTTAKQTHESIRAALKQYDSWPSHISHEDIDIYLQGSYKNDTNIRGDSDVDVVVQLKTVFHNNLTEEQRKFLGFISASYGWEEFREDILKALQNYYGSNRVRVGNKCLKVRTSYLPADVVVCIQYRKYRTLNSEDYVEGITFFVPNEKRWVINYPKLHYENGVEKNKSTNEWYKPTIRLFKNARTYLIKRNGLPSDFAPSYFLECLLYNVPDSEFGSTFQDTFCNVLNWLWQADLNQFLCQNQQLLLFGNSPEQWSQDRCSSFMRAMINLWNNWG